eukprot:15465925-Alexandrium_andersonii.AAC.1
MTMKFHYVLHVGNIAAYCNPRLSWCYSGEDLMQKVKTLVAASNRGTAAHKVMGKVLQKYAFGLGLKIAGI